MHELQSTELFAHSMTNRHEGRTSRESRVRESKGGCWGSSSQDFVHLADLLYRHSLDYARSSGGNCSIYTLAGIPMLLSGLRCLVIELCADVALTGEQNRALLKELAATSSELRVILNHYSLSPELRERLELLVQVRHEILHPAHRPGGDRGNAPRCLLALRDTNLLESTGGDTDYIWLDQLKSHRLFEWAFETVARTVDLLLDHHQLAGVVADGIRQSWWSFKHHTP